MFTAPLFTTAKLWKQPKQPLTDEWVDKMCYIYKTECHLAIKKNEVLIYAATWMDLKNIK